MSAASAAAPAPTRRLPTWLIVTISVFFGLFYAYALWNALAFLIAQAGGPFGLNAYGWIVLGSAVVFPLIAFGVAFAIGWKRSWWQFALILLTGLAVVAVFWLNVVAFSATNGASLLG